VAIAGADAFTPVDLVLIPLSRLVSSAFSVRHVWRWR
jgi:hypothetical protein